MTYTHSFIGYIPPARFDGEPWTQVRIEESATQDGVYAVVETVALAPLDADPELPAPRSVTTDEATLEQGWFRLVFLDAGGQAAPASAPVRSPGGAGDFAPSVSDVATLLRARTTDDEQEEAGTFNDETRPTGVQAQALIDQAVEDVLVAFVNGIVPEASKAAATRAATFRAAYLIEITFFPEQSTSPGEDSPYLQLRSLSESALQGLVIGTQLRDMFGLPS